MGGNASPFVADLFLAWREFCFIREISKSDRQLAFVLSNNSRYIDDILVINHIGFGDIAYKIYPESLILEKSSPFTKRENFLDLHIRIINNKFLTGIYHKVDDFNFDVINFPFNTSLGYTTFYSQLIRFARLCSSGEDFYLRTNLILNKLCTRGYDFVVLKKYFFRFCSKYDWTLSKYNHKSRFSFWKACELYRPPPSIDINDTDSIKTFTKSVSIKLHDIYAKEKMSFHLKKCKLILENCSALPKTTSSKTTQKTTAFDNFGDENTNNENACLNYTSQSNCQMQRIISLQIPIGIKNPKNHCYLNSVLQTFLCIFYHRCGSFDRINNNDEGEIFRLFQHILYNDIRYIYHLKQRLATYDHLLNGELQQDSNDCFNKICSIIDLGTRYSLLGDDFSDDTVVFSLSKELFSFMSRTVFTCTSCQFSSDTFSMSYQCFLSLKEACSIESYFSNPELFQTSKTCASCCQLSIHKCKKEITSAPNIFVIIIKRFDCINGVPCKRNNHIYIPDNIIINGSSYQIISSIHHHGDYITSGHYTCQVRYKSFFNCNDLSVKALQSRGLSSTAYMLFYNKL
jgi:ubiquitin C-terminal hydrolase